MPWKNRNLIWELYLDVCIFKTYQLYLWKFAMLKEHGNPCVHSMRLLNPKTSIIPTQGQGVTKALQHTVVNT